MRMDVKFCQSNDTFSDGFKGAMTVNGATYLPHVSDDGMLFWTNDQNLPNPEPVKINGSGSAKVYYHTEREEVGVAHEVINAEYIYGLYDALMAEFPNVQKKEYKSDDGTFTNYVYVISTGEYSTSGYYTNLYEADEHITKPKYLVMSGIHGRERKTAFSVYRFVRDLLSGHKVPSAFKEGVILHVMPVACPWGFDNYTRWNANQVNIYGNFPTGEVWEETWSDVDLDGEKDDYYNGKEAASEVETQAIIKWLEENADAELFIDVHNGSMTNEITCIFGVPDNDRVDAAKKTALRGIDRIIPFWRDVIGYPTSMKEATVGIQNGKYVISTVDKPVLFSYCVSSEEKMKSGSFIYATNMVGIPSIAIELSTYYGDWDKWAKDEDDGKYGLAYHPESIAAGAEAIGNILIEFYEQAFLGEVNEDMKQIDGKLDNILEGVSFRIERGVMQIPTDILPEEGKSVIYVEIPHSAGVKLIDWHADETTRAAIEATQGTKWVCAQLINKAMSSFANVSSVVHPNISMTYQSALTSVNNGWVPYQGIAVVKDTDNGVQFAAAALKAGRYEWTAYYWNE